ncbi:MAG TPA: hypothetical protein VNW97_01965 [Candidatus Saccharimonadales bacterium]|jgi:hypothetical protein|nr:hypothetical protein [Candidatus Saccharimonadales bacterium]
MSLFYRPGDFNRFNNLKPDGKKDGKVDWSVNIVLYGFWIAIAALVIFGIWSAFH